MSPYYIGLASSSRTCNFQWSSVVYRLRGETHLNMKITIQNTIIILLLINQVFGATVKLPVAETIITRQFLSENENETVNRNLSFINADDSKRSSPSNLLTLSPKAAANLAEKVITSLRDRQPIVVGPNKQLFGGAFPSFIERVVQRIQNYFSVYNPPEYFDNRPSVISNDQQQQQQPGIAIICQNGLNESISCNSTSYEEYEENCDENAPEENANQPVADGYNIVITQTVVQDSTLNVYSAADAGPAQIVSNVLVILEPSANDIINQPQLPAPNENKFYVYVNPTKANKLAPKTVSEMPVNLQSYTNATTYTVFMEKSTENLTNNTPNEDISADSEQVETSKVEGSKCEGKECELKPEEEDPGENTVLASRAAEPERAPDTPNINLVLLPPDLSNKSCIKNKFDSSDIEYYILKPDDGSLSKNKSQSVHKTDINPVSTSYLPPVTADQSNLQLIAASNVTTVGQNGQNKFPLLFNLFNRRQEEPR